MGPARATPHGDQIRLTGYNPAQADTHTRLTGTLVRKRLRPTSGQTSHWDNLLQRFGVRFTPTKTSHVVQWRESDGRMPRQPFSELPPGAKVEVEREVARARLSKVVNLAKHAGGTPLHTATRNWFNRVSAYWRPRYRGKVASVISVSVKGVANSPVRLTPAGHAVVDALGSTPVPAVRRSDVMAVTDRIKPCAAEQVMAVRWSSY